MKSPFILHQSFFSVWPRRFALVLACATFPLLFVGGLVTSKGAGLAVPDWPTTFGYNMFLYPWSKMVGGIFYEHSHRLLGSLVGLLTIAFAAAVWLKDSRRWLRWWALGALALVILQGVVGGLRVVLLQHTLAIVHAGLAQAFFALTVALAVVTAHDWGRAQKAPSYDGARLFRLALTTTLLIYLQSIFGAVLRHTGTQLYAHLLFAALVAVHVMLVFVRVMRSRVMPASCRYPAVALALLLAVQLLLGAAAYLGKFTALLRLPMDLIVVVTTTHVVIGALMLACGVVLTLRSYPVAAAELAAGRKVLREQLSL